MDGNRWQNYNHQILRLSNDKIHWGCQWEQQCSSVTLFNENTQGTTQHNTMKGIGASVWGWICAKSQNSQAYGISGITEVCRTINDIFSHSFCWVKHRMICDSPEWSHLISRMGTSDGFTNSTIHMQGCSLLILHVFHILLMACELWTSIIDCCYVKGFTYKSKHMAHQ